ncbi:hypothetical protein FUAX_40250 (plasmid) [Fulvitalea axinellae]|uniref:Transposase IS30-like HTH domain-containing protein n=1 Tax=Fulvitalea axinellae TaxID=1182444 RepID=A0AAU9CMV4_9BACT|nr:hypothetical protein FUAX_40250 [Fulvitalea axinellae]
MRHRKIRQYKRLSESERREIANMKCYGFSIREIAEFIERSPSTVSREIRCNSIGGNYCANLAHSLYMARKRLYAICFRRKRRHVFGFGDPDRIPRNEIAWLSDLSRYMRFGRKFSRFPQKKKSRSIYSLWSLKPFNFEDLPYLIWVLSLINEKEKVPDFMQKHVEKYKPEKTFNPPVPRSKKQEGKQGFLIIPRRLVA